MFCLVVHTFMKGVLNFKQTSQFCSFRVELSLDDKAPQPLQDPTTCSVFSVLCSSSLTVSISPTPSHDHDSLLQSSTNLRSSSTLSLTYTPPHRPRPRDISLLTSRATVCCSPRPTSPVGKQSGRRWRPLAIHRMQGKCE